MNTAWRRRTWFGAWALVAASGAWWLGDARLQQLRSDFETNARIVHRLLSQKMVQNDAVMATLALLQPGLPGGAQATAAALRLPTVYPQILQVLQRTSNRVWPATAGPALAAAQAASQRSGHVALAGVDLVTGRYWLVQAGAPASYALQLDLRATVPWADWPMDARSSPVRVALAYGSQSLSVQAGRTAGPGWHYSFQKTLASPSQPFELIAQRDVGWSELPWFAMLAWCLGSAAALAAAAALWRQRVARQRAEELLRLGQVARLNTLGELAAGMAHELNQPLTALLANTQAAQRLLAEHPADLETARSAMARAVAQARRAAAVVGRLRRLVERPDLGGQMQALSLAGAVHEALHLLEPELRRHAIAAEVSADADLPAVQAEPVALQQIVHNLLMNALQALEQVAPAQRRLLLQLCSQSDGKVLLAVRDHGPGVPFEARARLFEPFYSTRAGGLGLGLPLCESLAHAMGGSLLLAPADGPGARFELRLPMAPAAAASAAASAPSHPATATVQT